MGDVRGDGAGVPVAGFVTRSGGAGNGDGDAGTKGDRDSSGVEGRGAGVKTV